MLLVPLLAWLQYRWLGQVSEAERERMQRTLQTAAAQFAREFDGELSRAAAGLQLEGAVARDESWTSYAERFSAWADRAADPRLVREVLLVDAGAVPANPGALDRGARDSARDRERVQDRGQSREHDHSRRSSVRFTEAPVGPEHLRLRRWSQDRRLFEPASWDQQLEAARPVLAQYFESMHLFGSPTNGRFRREGTLALSIADDYTLLSPVTLVELTDDDRSPPRIGIVGFLLIRLDPAYVRDTLLPTLTSRHFQGEDGSSGYRVAVVDRDDQKSVIWESEPGAAGAIGAKPDVEQAFMSPRPDQMFFIARTGGLGGVDRRTAPQPPPPPPAPLPDERIVVSVMQNRGAESRTTIERGRGAGAFDGRWRVLASHRAGSLEAAVAAVRTRNLILSSGILLLLTTSIGLIVVSARRAQTLARQQMEFVAAVSHELRTPVSVIGTAAGNLADGVVSDPARVRKYGQTIQGEARRLGETVERVLQLAGIAAGRAAASRVRIAAEDLVQASLAACRTEIEAAGASVEVRVAEDAPPVEGDAAALRSALQNLISNAVKYGGDARWLRVSATAVPGGAARPGAPGEVAFVVEDRGPGVSAEDRAHIFEPFYRGRDAIARQIQGSGLGLNLVSRIADAHGGRVTLTSEPGKGSAFALILPASPLQPGAVGLDLPRAEPGRTSAGGFEVLGS
jgi:signal transduction histidine kinase